MKNKTEKSVISATKCKIYCKIANNTNPKNIESSAEKHENFKVIESIKKTKNIAEDTEIAKNTENVQNTEIT